MAMSKQERNDAVINALGHPIRRQILRMLDENTNGGISPKVVSDETGEALGTVSYHFRVLAEATVVKLTKEARRRGAIEHFYKRAGNAADKQVAKVLELIGKD